MTTLAIRPATSADAPEIAAIHVASWQAAYGTLLDPAWLRSLTAASRLPMWEGILADPAAAANVFVAIRDGVCAGFCSVGTSAAAPGSGVVHTIYVRPGEEGRGIGHALIERAERALVEQGYANAALWVLRDNARARRFYERHGWVTDGTEQQDDLFGQPVTDVRYEKRLAPHTT